MSSANSVTASVIARVQGAASNKGQKQDDSGGQAFAAIMRGTKSGAAVTANSGSHAKPRAEQTEADASAHDQSGHGPVRTDAFANRTMRQALPGADTSNSFAIPADQPAKGADAQSVVIDVETAAEPEGSGTRQDRDKAKAEGASSKSARPTSGLLPVAAKTDNAKEAKAGAPVEIAEPVRDVPAGAASEITSRETHGTADSHPKIRVATDLPALTAVSTGAQATMAKRIMETRQTAALHDAKVQEARAEHRREPGKAQPADETKATTDQSDAEPRYTTKAVDNKSHSDKDADTDKASKGTEVDGAAASISAQNDRDPVVPTLRSEGEAKPLPARTVASGTETNPAGPSSTAEPEGNGAAGRPSTQASTSHANAQSSAAAAASVGSAPAGPGIAPARASAALATAQPAVAQSAVTSESLAPAPGKATSTRAQPITETQQASTPHANAQSSAAEAASVGSAPAGSGIAPARASAALATGQPAVAPSAVTSESLAPDLVKVTPVRVQPVAETQQASAPQAFRAELTMAAANYAIFSGKSQTDAASPVAPAETADADDAEMPSQPIRIAILPPRAPQPAPILIAIPVPVAGAAAAASAPTAQAQAEAAAAALEAGLDDPAPIDSADAKSHNRPDPIAAAGPARSAATDSAFPQPAPTPAGAAASTVMAAIAAEPTWRPANVAALSHSPTSALAAEPKTLSIQLHPAELGVVTATLKLSGDQLTVEISAESAEARSRLSADSHAIAKSLRALGFDVDQVSIIQPMITSTPTIRTDDTSAVPGPQMRDQQSSGAGTSGGGGGQLGGQQTERNGNDGSSASRSPGTPAADRSGGGLYI